jgi:hypothetical protein
VGALSPTYFLRRNRDMSCFCSYSLPKTFKIGDTVRTGFDNIVTWKDKNTLSVQMRKISERTGRLLKTYDEPKDEKILEIKKTDKGLEIRTQMF